MPQRYIDGIYNYCDRWCERCPMTARCRVFAEERRDLANPAARDPDNEVFWQRIGEAYARAMTMLEAFAKERGIVLDEAELREISRRTERNRQRAERHPLVQTATAYAMQVQDWIKERGPLFEQKRDDLVQQVFLGLEGINPEAEALRLGDAFEVVRWYQFQPAVKLTRALTKEPSDRPTIAAAQQRDIDGSAKVALIGVDRSLAAWSILRDAFPDDDDTPLDLMLQLHRLREGIEREFPNAPDFVRPGFDE